MCTSFISRPITIVARCEKNIITADDQMAIEKLKSKEGDQLKEYPYGFVPSSITFKQVPSTSPSSIYATMDVTPTGPFTSIEITLKGKEEEITSSQEVIYRNKKEYSRRGDYIYLKPSFFKETLKNCWYLIAIPVHALFFRVILVGLLASGVRLISRETRNQIGSKDVKRVMKSFVFMVVGPVIAMVGLLSLGLASTFCNRLLGDIERWTTEFEREVLKMRDWLVNSKSCGIHNMITHASQPIAYLDSRGNLSGGSFEQRQAILHEMVMQNVQPQVSIIGSRQALEKKYNDERVFPPREDVRFPHTNEVWLVPSLKG